MAQPVCPHGHHILVIAEDGETLRRDGSRSNVEDRRRQLAGDLIHVGDHEQQALRRGKRRRQRASLKSAMNCTGGPTFTLHLHHCGNGTPDVFLAFGRPLVGPLTHVRGRCDRVDRDHLVRLVSDVRSSFVAVDGYFASRHCNVRVCQCDGTLVASSLTF
jgi:hypothetical protein